MCFPRIPFLPLAITITLSPYSILAQSRPQSIIPGAQTQVAAPTVSLYNGPGYSTSPLVNYVRTWDAQQPYSTEAALLGASNTSGVHRTTTYADGLGRPIETVSWQMSGTGQDIVAPQVYDANGREQYEFLPYEAGANTGVFQANPFADQNNFYTNTYPSDLPAFTGEKVFYGQTQFESSPLNRTLKVTAPGNSWTGNNVGTATAYDVNDGTDQVPFWTIGFASPADINNIPATSANYSPGTLYKTVTTDERGSQTIEYKDIDGHIIEKKVQVGDILQSSDPYTGWLVTMYVYDDMNQLRVVIPPKAVTQIKTAGWTTPVSLAILDGLCYRYEYDDHQRVLGKKVPGAGWIWMVYDQRDRLVFAQDANEGIKNEWATTLYDGLNRPVMTGMTTYNSTQAQLQSLVSQATVNPSSSVRTDNVNSINGIPVNLDVLVRQMGVTQYQASNSVTLEPGFNSEPGANFTVSITNGSPSSGSSTTTVIGNPLPSGAVFIPLTEHFYDDYTWGTTKSYNTSHNPMLDYGTNAYADNLPGSSSVMTRGLPTGTRVRALEDSANLALGGWLETASFYDDKGRAIQVESDNYKGGGDTLTQRFDFTGKAVATYLAHSNPQATSWIRIKTNLNYDGTGRLTSITKMINDNPNFQRTISRYTYTRMGELKSKMIGQRGLGDATPLETQAYDYNIRGWLKGINRPYADGTGTAWWGMDISYDWGFDSTGLNGNIAGIRWRSGSNGEQRSYGYAYDRANRLLYADFNQLFGSTWRKSDPTSGAASLTIDFSSWLGDGRNYSSAYDDNGNILKMYQQGLAVNNSQIIDNLSYDYGTTNPNNQLIGVTDSLSGNDQLGDFADGHAGTGDYGYDANGNMWEDQNKGINWITYDHLNLPFQLSVNPASGSKGTVTYIYDAMGNKLEKRVHELPGSADGNQDKYTTTDYLGDFTYVNNVLQYFNHEEGRVRTFTNAGGQVRLDTLEFDYFLKDHLGDTRMVLTDEHRVDAYPMATMEPANANLEDAFYANVDATRVPISNIAGYPADNTTNPNAYVAAVGGLQGSTHVGPSITLRVMARDTLDIRVSSWYNQTGSSTSYLPLPAANLASALSTGLTNAATVTEGSTVIPLAGLLQPDATNFLNAYNPPGVTAGPKAYLNWVFFDDQFRFVSSGSGSQQVQPNSSNTVNWLQQSPVAGKSGYVYIYVSNADSLTTVYFDNLQVTHSHGPMTEEDHYYPFGLTMKGISSQALAFGKDDNYKFNKGSEIQNKEFSDNSGLNLYATEFRSYEYQTGRFNQPDLLGDEFSDQSVYSFSSNNPISVNDFSGLEGTDWVEKKDKTIVFDAKVTNQKKATDTYGEGSKDLGKETNLYDSKTGQTEHGDASGNVSAEQMEGIVITGTKSTSSDKEGAPAGPPRTDILNSPVGDVRITSLFRVHRNVGSRIHLGTDYAVPTGTPVHATAPGVVVRSDLSSSYGNVVIINHGPAADGGGTVYTLYAHGSSRSVHVGQHVNTSQVVINSGATGHVTGPHLHYEVIETTIPVGGQGFYKNINIRYGPADLEGLLRH